MITWKNALNINGNDKNPMALTVWQESVNY